MLIDTPGLRSLGLVADSGGQGLGLAFPDIEVLAADCRFTECAHDEEPLLRKAEHGVWKSQTKPMRAHHKGRPR